MKLQTFVHFADNGTPQQIVIPAKYNERVPEWLAKMESSGKRWGSLENVSMYVVGSKPDVTLDSDKIGRAAAIQQFEALCANISKVILQKTDAIIHGQQVPILIVSIHHLREATRQAQAEVMEWPTMDIDADHVLQSARVPAEPKSFDEEMADLLGQMQSPQERIFTMPPSEETIVDSTTEETTVSEGKPPHRPMSKEEKEQMDKFQRGDDDDEEAGSSGAAESFLRKFFRRRR